LNSGSISGQYEQKEKTGPLVSFGTPCRRSAGSADRYLKKQRFRSERENSPFSNARFQHWASLKQWRATAIEMNTGNVPIPKRATWQICEPFQSLTQSSSFTIVLKQKKDAFNHPY
jgi:hypothetical protein